jgi:hypothetical protein
MGHGDMLLVLLSPRSSSEQFGAGARPVHPILGHPPAFHAAIARAVFSPYQAFV